MKQNFSENPAREHALKISDIPIRSHRKGIGHFIIAYKKLVRLIIEPYTKTIFEAHQEELHSRFQTLQQDLEQARGELSFLRSELNRQAHQLSLQASDSHSSSAASPPEYSLLEKHYFDFESCYRGSQEDIRKKQEYYAPILKVGLEKTSLHDGFVLDIACGRGELLQTLRDFGVPARGVEANPRNIEHLRSMDFDVFHEDAISYLRKQPLESIGGISCCQFIEYLPTDVFLEFIELCFSRLAPGAALILETLNPLSTYAMQSFRIDPSRQNPIHPEALRFLLTAVGFPTVDLQFQASVPEHIQLQPDNNPNTKKLNEFLFGYRTYATICYR